jgi:7-cyano-7-deazaguanine synthase
MTTSRPAVVLLSGGLDSATALAVARRDGFRCHALTVAYGQRHAPELAAAARVAQALGAAEHRVVPLDLRPFGGSALTADIPVPVDRPPEEMSAGIPVTYVPARNTVFLSLALAWAEVLGSFDILMGVNAIDYSGYPDCRPEFVRAFEALANLATKAGVEFSATEDTEEKDEEEKKEEEKKLCQMKWLRYLIGRLLKLTKCHHHFIPLQNNSNL